MQVRKILKSSKKSRTVRINEHETKFFWHIPGIHWKTKKYILKPPLERLVVLFHVYLTTPSIFRFSQCKKQLILFLGQFSFRSFYVLICRFHHRSPSCSFSWDYRAEGLTHLYINLSCSVGFQTWSLHSGMSADHEQFWYGQKWAKMAKIVQ